MSKRTPLVAVVALFPLVVACSSAPDPDPAPPPQEHIGQVSQDMYVCQFDAFAEEGECSKWSVCATQTCWSWADNCSFNGGDPDLYAVLVDGVCGCAYDCDYKPPKEY